MLQCGASVAFYGSIAISYTRPDQVTTPHLTLLEGLVPFSMGRWYVPTASENVYVRMSVGMRPCDLSSISPRYCRISVKTAALKL